VCVECLDRVEKDLTIVRDYLDNNTDHRTVGDIVDNTGVSRKVIMHLLREGRISIDDPSGGTLSCGLCGTPIETGRFCEKCRNKFVEKIDNLSPPLRLSKKREAGKKPETKRHKMHIRPKPHKSGDE
jgi:hypothetical protein